MGYKNGVVIGLLISAAGAPGNGTGGARTPRSATTTRRETQTGRRSDRGTGLETGPLHPVGVDGPLGTFFCFGKEVIVGFFLDFEIDLNYYAQRVAVH